MVFEGKLVDLIAKADNQKTTITRSSSHSTQAQASELGGQMVDIRSGQDLRMSGSNVLSDTDLNLSAHNNLTIEAAHNSDSHSHFTQTKKSGLFSGGGIGITLGSQQQSHDAQQTITTAAASTVGSVGGNVSLTAGNAYTQTGSDLLAPAGDIDIRAQTITLQEARETGQQRSEHKFKQSGLTLAITSPVIEAVETIQTQAKAASNTDSSRMQALAAANIALNANQAVNAVQAGQHTTDGNLADQAGGIGISLSLGSSSSKNLEQSHANNARGSTLGAAGDVHLQATGAGEASDITVQGSRIHAGQTASLQADGQINLLAAQNTTEQQSHNSSNSASVGIGFSLGGQNNGFTLNLGASQGRGNADGLDIQHSNTHLSADTLFLSSGSDMTLRGAVAEAERIQLITGGDLLIESLQDSSYFDSKQKNSSIGVSLCIPPFCYGTSSGSFSASNSQAHGNFASVIEQSGIRAGDGGFDIAVGGHTALKGGLIASDATAEHNRLVTATLTTEDLANRAQASASASGISLGSDMLTQGKYGIAKALIANTQLDVQRAGSDSGQTRSAIAAGGILITDNDKQQQLTGYSAEETVEMLNRDTDTAHSAAQRQDTDRLLQQVEAEWAIKAEAFEQLKRHVTDPVYRADSAEKQIILTRDCSNVQGECQEEVVINPDEHAFVHGPDGQIYVFNHGINNTEDEAIVNAIKQHGQTAHEAGIYNVINPHTGNIVTEVVYATLDKLREITGWNWLLGVSNASLARNDLVNAVSRHNHEVMKYGGQLLRIDEANHSRGSLTASNATQLLIYEGHSDVPIASVLFNGAAANAERMAGRIEQTTGGQGQVWQSTHKNDFVGTLIGGNESTGGQTAGFGRAHSSYGSGTPEQDREEIWGDKQGSIFVPVPATSQAGEKR